MKLSHLPSMAWVASYDNRVMMSTISDSQAACWGKLAVWNEERIPDGTLEARLEQLDKEGWSVLPLVVSSALEIDSDWR